MPLQRRQRTRHLIRQLASGVALAIRLASGTRADFEIVAQTYQGIVDDLDRELTEDQTLLALGMQPPNPDIFELPESFAQQSAWCNGVHP